MTADSEKDISDDDLSFYIGNGEEGFYASESVYDSDISGTDSEADDDDDGDWSSDDESVNEGVEEDTMACLIVVDPEFGTFNDVSLSVEGERFCKTESVCNNVIRGSDNKGIAADDGNKKLVVEPEACR